MKLADVLKTAKPGILAYALRQRTVEELSTETDSQGIRYWLEPGYPHTLYGRPVVIVPPDAPEGAIVSLDEPEPTAIIKVNRTIDEEFINLLRKYWPRYWEEYKRHHGLRR